MTHDVLGQAVGLGVSHDGSLAVPSHSPAADRDFLVIALAGDVDMARRPELDELIESFRASSAAHVEVDLTDVEFMDSTGLSALAALRSIAVARGGAVRLVRPGHVVSRALDVSGLRALFEVVG